VGDASAGGEDHSDAPSFADQLTAVGEDAATLAAERDDLKAQLNLKDKEYVTQHRMAQKLGSMLQQEQKKYAKLSTFLQKALRKMRVLQDELDKITQARSVLDNAVDTATSLSLDDGDPLNLEANRGLAHSIKLGTKGKRGKRTRGTRLRGESTTASPRTGILSIPDVEGEDVSMSILDENGDPVAPAAHTDENDLGEHLKSLTEHTALPDDEKLDNTMQEEDEQIQILEQDSG
jgi:hypothetical protein